jgi:hypothetical protein
MDAVVLLEIVLSRTACLAAGEGAFMVPFAGVDAGMASEMAAGAEGAIAYGADVFFLLVCGRGTVVVGVVLGR